MHISAGIFKDLFKIVEFFRITTSQSFGGPTVVTKYGGLKGIKSVSRGGRDYFEFLAIPYAKPPTGELRFEVGTKII